MKHELYQKFKVLAEAYRNRLMRINQDIRLCKRSLNGVSTHKTLLVDDLDARRDIREERRYLEAMIVYQKATDRTLASIERARDRVLKAQDIALQELEDLYKTFCESFYNTSTPTKEHFYETVSESDA